MTQPRHPQVEREQHQAFHCVPHHQAAGQTFVDIDIGTGHGHQGTGQVQVIAVNHNPQLVGVGQQLQCGLHTAMQASRALPPQGA